MNIRRLEVIQRKKEAGLKLTAKEDFTLRHGYVRGYRRH